MDENYLVRMRFYNSVKENVGDPQMTEKNSSKRAQSIYRPRMVNMYIVVVQEVVFCIFLRQYGIESSLTTV